MGGGSRAQARQALIGLGLLLIALLTPARHGPMPVDLDPPAAGEIQPQDTEPLDGPRGPARSGADLGLGGTREPTIAINPINPQMIAMASLFRARVSLDGGATWSAEIAFPMPPPHPCGLGGPKSLTPAGDPTMTFDSRGRLFWCGLMHDDCFAPVQPTYEVWIFQIDPLSEPPAAAGGPYRIAASLLTHFVNDKPWIAAHASAASPYRDRLHAVWTELVFRQLLTSYSDDQGATWSAPVELSAPNGAEGYVWPGHVAVAPSGDVYVAYHAQTELAPGCVPVPSGSDGRVYVVRSADGGESWPQKRLAFAAGAADVTFNMQREPPAAGRIPNTSFVTVGSAQAWVLPDPRRTGWVYVVAADDPDDVHGKGDDSDVFFVRSTDYGDTWSAPQVISHQPATPPDSFQLFPTAAIDRRSGAIAAAWYDNRRGQLVERGDVDDCTNLDDPQHFLLDVYCTISTDGGLTFAPDVQINDSDGAFDPFHRASSYALTACPPPHCPPTRRIGEYFGVAMENGGLSFVWTGNRSAADARHEIKYAARSLGVTADCPADVTGDRAVDDLDVGALLEAWQARWEAPPGPRDANYNYYADVERDGRIDNRDLQAVLDHWLQTCP